MDATVSKPGALVTPISIVQGWGDTSNTLFNKWSSEAADDSKLPIVGNYPCNPMPPATPCAPDWNQPTGRYAREKTGASYLAQYTRAAHLHAALINGVAQLHHVIGIAFSDDSVSHVIGPSGTGGDYTLSDSYTRLDIDSGLSLTNKTANATDKAKRRAALHALVASAAAIEGSMLAQQEDVPDTSSTATRFEWGNAPPSGEDPSGAGARKFLQFDSTNAGSVTGCATSGCGVILWESHTTPPAHSDNDPTGSPQDWGTHYQDSLTGDIVAYVGAGFSVVSSQESWLGPGQRGGAYFAPATDGAPYTFNGSKQRGNAFVAIKYASDGSPSEITHAVSGLIKDGVTGNYSVTKGGAEASRVTIRRPTTPAKRPISSRRSSWIVRPSKASI
ncbi:MAG: hypothetical protein WDM89_22260 [Rhizomicrobium sp.]